MMQLSGSNLLLVSELLFSLPFTNAKVERTFSNLKVIKNDRRTSLLTSTLDDLMEITCEGPPMEVFSAEHAVKIWWEDCTRRPNQRPRKEYRPRENTASSDLTSGPSTSTISFEDWDNWFQVD